MFYAGNNQDFKDNPLMQILNVVNLEILDLVNMEAISLVFISSTIIRAIGINFMVKSFRTL